MIVVELTGATDNIGTLETFYLSDEPYATKASDTPANKAFLPTLKKRGTISLSLFGDGRVSGGSTLDVGEIVVSNANGSYDHWLNYGFGGRPLVIRHGEAGGVYPGSFSELFTGTVDSIYVDRAELRIRIKDPQRLFERPCLTNTYAGNNALPSGAEGGSDIKGRVKPKVYGAPLNASPVLVNTSKLTYQIHDGALTDIAAVYDRGASLTKGANFANLSALEAASPSAGSYVTCLALGLFRLGSAPAGQITCDPVQGATAADRTTAQVLKALALDAGVASGKIDASAVAALDTANPAPVGIYVDDERPFAEAMDEIAQSVGAFYSFQADGGFVVGRWEAPSGSSAVTIGEFYIGQDYQRRPLRDGDAPTYQVKVGHSKVNTVQSDLAGSVSASRKAFVGQEYRTELASNLAVKTQFDDAQIYSVDTLLVNQADAAAEAARLLAMLSVRRDSFELPVPVRLLSNPLLKLGACVTLQINRFGLSGGKLMRVSGIRLELASNRAVLTVWG